MTKGRIVIIPFLHGKLTADGKLIEPNIEAIFEKWLERYPQFRGSERNYRTIRAKTSLPEGTATDLVRVTAEFTPELADYDPAADADLYDEFLAEGDDEFDAEEVEDMRKDDIRQCTRDLLLVERAREWLLEQ